MGARFEFAFENIEKKVNENGLSIYEKRIEKKFPSFVIVPIVHAPLSSRFFIEEGSYIRFTYSWK